MNMIAVIVFFLINHQINFHLVYIQKEICHYDPIPSDLKEKIEVQIFIAITHQCVSNIYTILSNLYMQSHAYKY